MFSSFTSLMSFQVDFSQAFIPMDESSNMEKNKKHTHMDNQISFLFVTEILYEIIFLSRITFLITFFFI